MGTTRIRHEHSQEVQAAIIAALRDNVGDYFSSAEISDTIGSDEINTQHVASILKTMIKEGTASQSRERGSNLYCLRPEALLWHPAPYDWRVSKGIGQTVAQSVTPPVTQDIEMFIPAPPPPGVPALSIDQPPFHSTRLAMAPDILGTEPPPVPMSFEDELPPPGIPALAIDHAVDAADFIHDYMPFTGGTEPPPVLMSHEDESPPPILLDEPDQPVETKKECRCTRVAKLPPLPHGWAITSIKLEIEDTEDHGIGIHHKTPRLVIGTVDDGYLDWKMKGLCSMNPGDMAQIGAVGDALLQLHIESQSHE